MNSEELQLEIQDIIDKFISLSEAFQNNYKKTIETPTNKEIAYKIQKVIEEKSKINFIFYGPEGFGRKSAIHFAIQQLSQSKQNNMIQVFIDGMLHSTEINIVDAMLHALQQKISIKKDEVLKNIITLESINQYVNMIPNFSCLLLVLDQIEVMTSMKKQVLLYSLLEWVQTANFPIIFIGITTDLKFEDKLEKRVRSRFQHTSQYFFNYSVETIKQICLQRVQSGFSGQNSQLNTLLIDFMASKDMNNFISNIQLSLVPISTIMDIIRNAFSVFRSKGPIDIETFNNYFIQSVMTSYKLYYPYLKMELLRIITQPETMLIFSLFCLILQQKPQIYFSTILDHMNQKKIQSQVQGMGNVCKFSTNNYNQALDNLIKLGLISLESFLYNYIQIKDNMSKNLENNQIILKIQISEVKKFATEQKDHLPKFIYSLSEF